MTTLTSAITTSSAVTKNIKTWTLSDLGYGNANTPTLTILNTIPIYVTPPFDVQQNSVNSTYRTLGRNRPLVIADQVQGGDGTLSLVCIGQSVFNSLQSMLTLRHYMILQSPYGHNFNIRHAAVPGTAMNSSIATFEYQLNFSAIGQEYYTCTFDFVSVDLPTSVALNQVASLPTS